MDYAVHEPEYAGTTREEWSAPDMEDFDTDDLGAIDDHFLLSASDFPPDAFTDLKLPVVDPDGNLNLNALQTAHGGAHGVGAVEGVSDDTADEVGDLLERLADEAFDHDLGE